MVHCFAIARLMGRPGADRFIDHGMEFLWNGHRDAKNGGYFWGVGEDGPSDPLKQAYGHAFVLLAASSAKVVGHPDADRLLADVSEVLRTRFWEKQHGAVAEEFAADWQPISNYRGQNSNMHLTEGADGRLRGDRRQRLARHGREHRHAGHRQARGRERLAGRRALRREVGARSRLCERRRLSALRHHARPLARMDAAPAPALGARRPAARLAARGGEGALRSRDRGRLGPRERRLPLHARLGRHSRACATGSGGRRPRGSARRPS